MDADYAALGDPMKLLSLAACNRCADMRVRKRTIETEIEKVCTMLVRFGHRLPNERLSDYRHSLTFATKAYADMICAYLNATAPAWDEECVNLLMDKPHNWPAILKPLWSMYAERPTRAVSLPFVDA